MHAQIPGSGQPGAYFGGPIEHAIELVGDRWTLLILHQALLRGTTRFGDFNRSLRIPTGILTRRLNSLVRTGLLERVAAPQGRSLHEYRLTEKGHHLWPVMAALLGWSADWLQSPDKPRPLLRHSTCGATVSAAMHCSGCGDAVPELEMAIADESDAEPELGFHVQVRS